MKLLLTIKEYAKREGISEIGVRKRVSSNYNKSIKIDKEVYIILDDSLVKNLKNMIKNKNSKIRELKLQLKVKGSSNDERYIDELNKQVNALERKLELKDEKIDGLQDQKDTMYERFLSTLVNSQKKIN